MNLEKMFEENPVLFRPAKRYLGNPKIEKKKILEDNSPPKIIGKCGYWKRGDTIRHSRPKTKQNEWTKIESTMYIQVGFKWIQLQWNAQEKRKYEMLKNRERKTTNE